MARSRQRDAWNHTANILALLINVNRDPRRGSPAKAEDIHPIKDDLEPLSVEQQNAMLREQFKTARARIFHGKVTYIKPFTPGNAEKLKNGKPRSN